MYLYKNNPKHVMYNIIIYYKPFFVPWNSALSSSIFFSQLQKCTQWHRSCCNFWHSRLQLASFSLVCCKHSAASVFRETTAHQLHSIILVKYSSLLWITISFNKLWFFIVDSHQFPQTKMVYMYIYEWYLALFDHCSKCILRMSVCPTALRSH